MHILAFSTNGHVFYFIIHLIDYSMLVHNAFLLFFWLHGIPFVWVSIILGWRKSNLVFAALFNLINRSYFCTILIHFVSPLLIDT